jgi:hypothetical protein
VLDVLGLAVHVGVKAGGPHRWLERADLARCCKEGDAGIELCRYRTEHVNATAVKNYLTQRARKY